MNFIDIHCHILPGLDDGPLTIEESLKMIEIAKQDGISHIFATPHIIDGMYDNGTGKILDSVKRLRAHVSDTVNIFYGADVRITFDLIEKIERKEVLTLNSPRYMLIEFPEYIVPPHVDNLIFNLRHRGITPIITHPERHLRLMRDLPALSALREEGALCQITAMSITGGFGRSVKKACFTMIEKELVDFVASDAHNSKGRPPILSKAYEDIDKRFGRDISDRIFFSNPKMVVEAVQKDAETRI
jgi:protein-tyrosine phosphatase